MKLELFDDLLNNAKEKKTDKHFIKELLNCLEKTKNKEKNSKSENKEEELFQVIEMGTGYAYLQNVKDNKISKKIDIPKEILEKIGNDTVLKHKDGKYIVEEELTKKFLDGLIEIKEYKEIQNKFAEESKILQNNSNTRYKIKLKNERHTVLTYGDKEKNTIKVPNALIPFWANNETILYYKNGKFNREV